MYKTEEYDENDRVKIHYIGYGEENKWKSRDNFVRPTLNFCAGTNHFPFATLACMVKKQQRRSSNQNLMT